LPGNHDYKPSMGSVLPSTQIVQAEHALLGEHWQMILLDSQVEGVPHGRLSQHDNVRAILCGHVHQDMQKVRSGATVISTPSTCVQFKPNSDDFALDTCSPGWRELTLYADGQFETHVQRLAGGLFLPNFDSSGY